MANGAIAEARKDRIDIARCIQMIRQGDHRRDSYAHQALHEAGKQRLLHRIGNRFQVQQRTEVGQGGMRAIEQAQLGAIQIARVSVGALGPVVDALNVFNLPFLFRDTAHLDKVLDGPIGQELLARVTDNPQTHLVGLCWMDAGARSMYDTKHPIRSVADLKGMKMRVMGNPMFVDMMNALGGNGIAMGYDQVFSALQTGVVDGAENNPPSFVFDNHYQVAKYYGLTEHLMVPEILVFSRRAWDGLDKADQELITKFAREAQLEERVFWNNVEKDAMTRMKAAGIEIDTISDKKQFQDLVKPVWDKYGAKYADLIKRIQAVN